ncbi:hypothetical protein PTSG_09730 [Salpingoeca rosetta]|uniref:Poly [ADP-ribose] polymerase n=1 Tax=Salpingoeca rosetta (strain ATCC 50818 / BSB-021) TaxID=946362 RepID=F2UNW1_SALR5|nr:uncharacterized protein PTSG_09730 [Salpingoeca rosetta]EGD79316.1 hypothetical protein PTSG_09730 [Salpingoeca rosetta]|eukprot:XP_004989085.1 hypothetical protein PTSG_09730 [Salpingoeca rosetta]
MPPHRKGQRCPHGSKAVCRTSACYYVHTDEKNVECDFGSGCTNASCPRVHPAPLKFQCQRGRHCSSSTCDRIHPAAKKSQTLCIHDEKCTNASCQRQHPKRDAMRAQPQPQPMFPKSPSMFGKSPSKSPSFGQHATQPPFPAQPPRFFGAPSAPTPDGGVTNVPTPIPGKMYYVNTFGNAKLREIADAVSQDMSWTIDRKNRAIVITGATMAEREVVKNQFKSFLKHNLTCDRVEVEGCTFAELKENTQALNLAKRSNIIISYHDGAVDLTYQGDDGDAVAVLPRLEAVLRAQAVTTQVVPLPNNERALISVVRAATTALADMIANQFPNTKFTVEFPGPVMTVRGPASSVQRAAKRITAYLQDIKVLKRKAKKPSRQLAHALCHFLRRAVRQINADATGNMDGDTEAHGEDDDASDDNDDDLGVGPPKPTKPKKHAAASESDVEFPYILFKVFSSFFTHPTGKGKARGKGKGPAGGSNKNSGGDNADFVRVQLTGPSDARKDLERLAQRVDAFIQTFVSASVRVKKETFNTMRASLLELDVNEHYRAHDKTLLLSGAEAAVEEAKKRLDQAEQRLRPLTYKLHASSSIMRMALLLRCNSTALTQLRDQVARAFPDVNISIHSGAQDAKNPGSREVARLVGTKDVVVPAHKMAEQKLQQLEQDMLTENIELDTAELGVFQRQEGRGLMRNARDMGVVVLSPRDAHKMLEADSKQASKHAAASTPSTPAKVSTPAATPVLMAHVAGGTDTAIGLKVLCGDFKGMHVDAIVNAANEDLMHCGGIAFAIAKAAGLQFSDECQKSVAAHGRVRAGTARHTSSGDLAKSTQIKHVLHAVAPIYSGDGGSGGGKSMLSSFLASLPKLGFGGDTQAQLSASLRACVQEAIRLAGRLPDVSSIGIPAIGSGVFGWPEAEATREIVKAVVASVNSGSLGNIKRVVLFDAMQAKASAFAAAVKALAERDGAGGKSSSSTTSSTSTTSSSASYHVPRVLEKPEYVWMWRFHERDQWVMYDWDQQVQIEQAHGAGRQDDFRISGDRGGVRSDSKHIPEGEKYPVYFVNLGKMTQRNAKSNFERRIQRVRWTEAMPLPPLFEDRRQEALALAQAQQRAQRSQSSSSTHMSSAKGQSASSSSSSSSSARIVNVREPKAVKEAETGGSVPKPSSITSTAALPKKGFVLCGPRAKVQAVKDKWTSELHDMWQQSEIKLFENDREHNERLLDHKDVRAAIAKHGAKIRVNPAGNIVLEYVTESAFHEINSTMVKLVEEIKVPRTWTTMKDPRSVEVVPVPAGTQEYQDVVEIFSRGGFTKTVLKVERVQNKYLWDCYFHKRDVLNRHSIGANEKHMFHGTGAVDPAIIADTNFDFRYASAGLFGRGAYFAELMEYSDRGYAYVCPDDPTKRQVFIARVAAGKVEERGSNCDQSIKHQSPGFDSVGGMVTATHKAIIIYDLQQAYPEYLITYSA